MGGGNGEGGGNGDGGGEGTRDIIMLFSVRSVESGGRGKRILKIFQRLPKKKISKEFNFAVKSGKRKTTQRDTLRAARNTQIQYTHE